MRLNPFRLSPCMRTGVMLWASVALLVALMLALSSGRQPQPGERTVESGAMGAAPVSEQVPTPRD